MADNDFRNALAFTAIAFSMSDDEAREFLAMSEEDQLSNIRNRHSIAARVQKRIFELSDAGHRFLDQ